MGKKKQPKAPKIPIPTPSAEEIALQKKQLDYMDMMTNYGQQSMGWAASDRDKAMGILDTLQNAPQLDPARLALIDQIAKASMDLEAQGITSGSNKEVFDRNRRDTLAGLADQGILNSTFGRQAIENLYKEQGRQLADVYERGGLNRMNLENQWLQSEQNKNMNLFNTLYGGSGQQMQLGGSQLGAAANTAASVSGQMKSNRMDAYNANVSNLQTDYINSLRAKQKSGAGGTIGSIGGAVIGGIGGAFLGNPMMGAMLGAGIGGSVGSLF